MAHELYTRTNQKIYFAGLSLEALARAEEGRAMNSLALIQAGRESALFHLYGALLGLCHEIAGFYRLPQANAPRAEMLLTREVLESIAIPELAEMVELANNPETWLAKLLAAHAALFVPPHAPKAAKVDPTLPLINAVNLDEEQAAPELSSAELEAWRQQLKVLALRFRETLTEW